MAFYQIYEGATYMNNGRTYIVHSMDFEQRVAIARGPVHVDYYTSVRHTLQHALQHIATHCHILQHTATHCNTMQHSATHCYVHCGAVARGPVHID